MYKYNHRFSHLLIFLLCFICEPTFAQRTPINLFIPYDPFIVPIRVMQDQSWQWSFYTESGLGDMHAINNHGDFVSPLHIWNDSENVVTMLEGAPENSPATELRNEIGTVTNNFSGVVIFDGKYKEHFSGVFAIKKTVIGDFSLTGYLPFYSYQLENVSFIDRTGNETASDRLIKSKITDHLPETLQQLGSLSIAPWKQTSLGDLTLQGEWSKTFLQPRPVLKAVQAYLHAGITLPTAKRADPDKLLNFSFGNNGAFSIPFGAALDLRYWDYARLGIDVLLVHTFAHNEERRIQTTPNQTNLLLLQKAECYVDYGLTQRFYLYGAVQDLIPYVTISLGYHFEKQGEDTIYVQHNEFQTSFAQNTRSLEERTIHQIIAYAQFKKEFDNSAIMCSVVSRIPFNGKRVLVSKTIGVSLSVAF